MTVRRPFVGIALAALLSLAACSGANRDDRSTGPSTSATPSAATTPAATPSSKPTEAPADFTPNGLGPYVINARLTELQDRGLAVDVEETPACPGIAVGKGTDTYQAPALVFYLGGLQYLSVASAQIPTSKGVRVGMGVAQIQKAYPDAITLNDSQGGMAMMVKSGKNALLFRIRTAGTIESIEAGLAEVLEFRFTDGEGC